MDFSGTTTLTQNLMISSKKTHTSPILIALHVQITRNLPYQHQNQSKIIPSSLTIPPRRLKTLLLISISRQKRKLRLFKIFSKNKMPLLEVIPSKKSTKDHRLAKIVRRTSTICKVSSVRMIFLFPDKGK